MLRTRTATAAVCLLTFTGLSVASAAADGPTAPLTVTPPAAAHGDDPSHGGPVYAYVTNQDGDTVSVIDLRTDAVTATIPVGAWPTDVVLTPMDDRAYVTNLNSDDVSVIDTRTDAVTATIPVGLWPRDVAFTPEGDRAYVANQDSDTVSVIDTKTETVTSTIPVGSDPMGLAITRAPSR